MIGDAEATIDDGILTLRIDLRPPDREVLRSPVSVGTSTSTPARATSEYGVLAGAIAVFAWGLGPLFVRAMGVSTPTTVAYRLIIAVPVMHLVAWLFGGRVTRRLMRVALVPGALFGISLITGFAAVNNTSVSNATLISNLMPVAVVILAKFVFDEQVRNRQFVAVGVALAGMLIVVFGAGIVRRRRVRR